MRKILFGRYLANLRTHWASSWRFPPPKKHTYGVEFQTNMHRRVARKFWYVKVQKQFSIRKRPKCTKILISRPKNVKRALVPHLRPSYIWEGSTDTPFSYSWRLRRPILARLPLPTSQSISSIRSRQLCVEKCVVCASLGYPMSTAVSNEQTQATQYIIVINIKHHSLIIIIIR